MSEFTTESTTGLVSRDQAKSKIIQMAKDNGINGTFKVFYQGSMISSPDNLPEQLSMGDVRVSAVLDQAYSDWCVVI